jgi:hypothetical protein
LKHFKKIEQISEASGDGGFQFDRIPGFITSSCDSKMMDLVDRGIPGAPKVFLVGSTSSTTGILSQMYFSLSNFAGIDMSRFSIPFQSSPSKFTKRTFGAAVVCLRKRKTPKGNFVWATDSVEQGSRSRVAFLLSRMGHVLERKLTMNREEYAAAYLNEDEEFWKQNVSKENEVYNVSQYGRILFRSQLDAKHVGLKGTRKVFDLKTRATAQIRYDMVNEKEPLIRLTRTAGATIGSFEKEIYDMSRNAFLKNYFQVQLGDMGGILVAFHNTDEMFGLHYFSKHRLAQYIGIDADRVEQIYLCSLGIMDTVIEYILNDLDGEGDDLLLAFKTDPLNSKQMVITAEVLRQRKECDIVPIEELREKYAKESVNDTDRDVKVTLDDRARVTRSVSWMDMETTIDAVNKGHIRRYACTLLMNKAGVADFEIVKDSERPAKIAYDWVKLLQEKESLDPEHLLKQVQ